jgi:hypothetical protein
MTNQEQQLIQAIKALPGHTVQMRDQSVCVIYRQASPTSIKSQSVWLGRPSAIGKLQQILEA